jgi:hypothetical protein
VKILKSGLLGLVLLTAAGSLGRAQQVVFNFDNYATNDPANLTYTPFTDTVNGLSATFTSNADPNGGVNGFVVAPAFLPSFSGNVLNENQGVHSYATLTITFSRPVNDFFLNFGLNDPNAANGTGMDVLNLVAFNNGAGLGQVGQSTNLGLPDVTTYPQGIALYDGTPFDSVSLSSPIDLFAIDNLSVETVVPEPSTISLWILGAGCILFGLWRRSRNQALCPASTSTAKSSIG